MKESDFFLLKNVVEPVCHRTSLLSPCLVKCWDAGNIREGHRRWKKSVVGVVPVSAVTSAI
jgi:hypothetical protein